MKLKYQILFFILLMNLECSKRTCKQEILRSMGFHGRITPIRGNGLCPKLTFNCCTMHDQMMMHKQWNNVIKHTVEVKNKNAVDTFKKLQTFFNLKGSMNLFLTNKQYLKMVKIKPPIEIEHHLDHLAKALSKFPSKHYNKLFQTITVGGLPKYYKWVKQARAGTLCGLCSYDNNRYFDIGEKKLIMGQKFCMNFVNKFIDVLNDKYVNVVHQLILFDEWVSIISNRHLFSDSAHLNMLKRLVLNVQKCKKKPNIATCALLCEEFNINKFTWLFNGEVKPFELFLRNLNKFLQELEKFPDDLYNKLPINWADVKETNKVNDQTALSKTMGVKEYHKEESKEMKIKMSVPKVVNFIEKIHPTNTVQIETLEDEADTYTLYKVKEKPTDLSTFKLEYKLFGFNPIEDGHKNHFRYRKEQIIAMLHSGGNDPNRINEIIEPEIKKTIDQITTKDMVNYFKDKTLFFRKMLTRGQLKKMMQQIKKMKKNARVLLQGANALVFFTKMIMGLLLITIL
jgi:hypothetical protein